MTIEIKIIDLFKERFKKVPSIFYIRNHKISNEILEKFLSKSHLVFINKTVVDNEIVEIDRLVEYDSTGIFIYIKDGSGIFILSTTDRLSVAEFTLHNLIKLNK